MSSQIDDRAVLAGSRPGWPTRPGASGVGVLLALLLAACGGNPASSAVVPRSVGAQSEPPASAPAASLPVEDAITADEICELITDEEIEELTNYPVLGKESSAAGSGSARCDWELDDDGTGVCCHYITLQVVRPYGRLEFDFRYLEDESAEHLDGFGDDAVVSPGSITVVTGDTLAELHFSAPDTTPTNDLMQAVLRRL